ncbi:MAG: phytanoyl-CoA dioxygenase family protein [Lentisphaeria bacterium]|jgi:phytanoyl-CoA hydroxylase|nr:phytanoyl-CoA dioxygenase family protein [Lentisphaeria bacterium]
MNLPTIKTEFEENGFIVVPQMFSPTELAAIDTQTKAYVADIVPALGFGDVFYEEPPSKAIKSLFHMETHAAFFDELRRHEGMLEMMRALFPGNICCKGVGLFGKSARDGSVTPVHQDNGFNYYEPPHCLKASIALDAHTPDNGVMICQKGSHKLGVQPHQPSGVVGFSQTLVEPVATDRYPDVAVCMEPGDLCLHHTDTVHRSGPNRTSRPRRMISLVFHSDLARHNKEKWAWVCNERERLYATLK